MKLLLAIVASAGIVSLAGSIDLPCDIYDSAGTPCVAAHSTVRALYEKYEGALYQVKRSDGGVLNVGTVDGVADAAQQDAFCASSSCIISIIYDQSGRKNHLTPAPAGSAVWRPDKGTNASRWPVTLSKKKVYGVYFEGNEGYRNTNTSGVATGDDAESMYAVFKGDYYNGGCCFDYGNAETNSIDDGKGTMEALYWGNSTGWGRGFGSGPWMMADLENGLWAGNQQTNPGNKPLIAKFVTGMLKGGANRFALKGGDAQANPPSLTALYEGTRPSGYEVMKKQGSIILGIGGDNSDWAVGGSLEGAMTQGYASDATDAAVHASIVAAGYGA